MRKSIKRLILTGLLVATTALADSGTKNSAFSRAPYLQLGTPDSMVIVWRTKEPITPVVKFGRDVKNLSDIVPVASVARRIYVSTNKDDKAEARTVPLGGESLPRLHSAPPGTWQYEAHVTGLTPSTVYYYGLFDGNKRLTPEDSSYRFVTHPTLGQARKTRFWIVGDSGTGREPQISVHSAMTQFVQKDRRPLDFYLHVGDMAYTKGRDAEFQEKFFEPYEPTLRNVVCWAAMGNHEGGTSKGTTGIGPYYDAYVCPTRAEAGGVPSGNESYYSFDYGRIHFVCLNSHDLDRKPEGAMARWLKLDLERTKADWLVAFFHHPPYTKGSHDSDKEKQLVDMRTYIMPILEAGGVDLVLTGHSHIYERSMLMDGAYATPTVAANVILDDRDGDPNGDGPYRKSAGLNPNEGDVQVVAGHGGTTLKRIGTMPVMRKIIVEHGSVIIDIDGDTLTGTMINKTGVVRDRFGIVKSGKVTPVRIAQPWQSPKWTPLKPPGVHPAVEPPKDFITLIPQNADWTYLADGKHPANDSWTKLGFKADGWKTGKTAIGYNYKDARTLLPDMRNNYSAVYIRSEFEVEIADSVSELGLMINYDDGFIAYLNGKEVLRVNVSKGNGEKAEGINAHEAKKHSYFKLKDFEKHLKNGKNVLAIEGHNRKSDSSDFLLDPYLIIED